MRERKAGATDLRARARTIGRRLAQAIPEPRCELDFVDPWQLLIATILSAQSTDRTVNRVAPALFSRYPTPAALAAAEPAEVERLIHATGFFRNKARAIVGASARIAEHHGGRVPAELDALVELPGVARKTANVVLGTAFGIGSGIVVDTHATRVARRLRLTRHDDPVKIERDLCELFPRKDWIAVGHRLVLHGRYHCLAKRPKCGLCPLGELCPSREQEPAGKPAARAAGERETVEAALSTLTSARSGPGRRGS